MAINLTDFDKIWASTSPLTPYAFSDNNYKQGWNFVGATPPARQMWDSYMKLSDEKSQWLYNNKLSLSGGTMTGALYSSQNDFFTISKSYDVLNQGVRIWGGYGYSGGASLYLYGKDHSSAGDFVLYAHDGTNAKALAGHADGTLTWAGKSILERAYGFTLVSSSGSNTYTFEIVDNSAVIFAKRGNNCSCHMVDYWTSGSVKIFATATDPITITKTANNGFVTITNVNNSSVGIKILNGSTL